jgi:glycosyltransferase involved in cell wall biosynthesis
MSPNRVVLAGFYPPPYAGEPIHVKQLARFLRDRSVEVDVLNLNRHAPPSDEYRGASTPFGLMRLLWTLPGRSSVLHLHTNGHSWKSWLMIATAALGARLRGTRTILTIHSGLFPGYVSTLGRLPRALARAMLRCFAKVIGVNRDIGHAMEGLGISGPKLAVIPAFLGVPDSAALTPGDRACIEGFRPVLMVVGGGDRDPEQGLPTVIETLSELIKLFPRLRAVFVGWQVGPKTNPLLAARGLAGHALCLGEISHERCLSFLQEADVIVRSTFADGDAITVREGLDLGVPVVASDTAFRPPGVVLFRKGDSQDLLAKLKDVLAGPSAGREPAASAITPAQSLWQIYAELVGRDATLGSYATQARRRGRTTVTPP